MATALVMASLPEFRNIVITFGAKHKDVPQLKFLSEDPGGFLLKPLDEQGFINHIFLASSKDGRSSAILKYGPEQGATEAFQHSNISLFRQEIEYNSLCLMETIIPGHIPTPYAFDRDLHIVAMENLAGRKVVGTYVMAGQMDDKLSAIMGSFFGRLHSTTHKDVLSNEQWQDMLQTFPHQEMKQFYLDLTMVKPYDADGSFNVIPKGEKEKYKDHVGHLRQKAIPDKLRTLYLDAQCFCHGDSHVNSFMTDGTSVQVIDFEFGGPGCAFFDITHLMNTYLFSGWDKFLDKDPNIRTRRKNDIRRNIETILANYMKAFGGMKRVFGDHWLSNFTLLLGSQLFRCSIFPNLEAVCVVDANTKLTLMDNGYKLMIDHERIQDTQDMLDVAFANL